MHTRLTVATASVAISGVGFLLLLSRFPEVYAKYSENWAPLFVMAAGVWLAIFQAVSIGLAYFCSRNMTYNIKRNLRWASISFFVGTLCILLATCVQIYKH